MVERFYKQKRRYATLGYFSSVAFEECAMPP